MSDLYQLASLKELYFSRLREFYRQPARIFWVYVFPTILAVVLGVAFQSRTQNTVQVDLIENASTDSLKRSLEAFQPEADKLELPKIEYKILPAEQAIKRLKTGKTPLVVEPTISPPLIYHYDPTRPEAATARAVFDDEIQRAAGRKDPISVRDEKLKEPGARYIDFLIPGLIALNTMGGGLWGVGFLLVNFRIAKLLKRFCATPMPRRNFLLAVLGARLTFLIPDVGVLLAMGVFAFHMPMRGDLFTLIIVELFGALAFAGIGLLVASRATTTETVSGLMNLVMVPMWLLSGVFFSSERFPAAMQPFVQALPLTQLVDALRRILLEGAGLASVAGSLAILAAWAIGTFLIALKLFKWT